MNRNTPEQKYDIELKCNLTCAGSGLNIGLKKILSMKELCEGMIVYVYDGQVKGQSSFRQETITEIKSDYIMFTSGNCLFNTQFNQLFELDL